MTQPEVSVIIAARDASATIERTLEAVTSQQLESPYEVIVVDDGSTDETSAIAERFAPVVRLVRKEESRGAGAARNLGVQISRAPVLAFTDADCFPTAYWLARGLETLGSAELVQGKVEPDPRVTRTPFDRTLAVERDRSFYQTANLFVRRELFDALAGFRDWSREKRGWWRFSVDGPDGRASKRPVGEDTLFGWMACRTGARSAFASDALVYHAVTPGGVRNAMAERWHWARDMPGLARLVPELRETTFHRLLFFNFCTAQFDLALAGCGLTVVSRRPVWLLAVMPYARRVAGEARGWGGRRALGYVTGTVAVDAVTLAGLIAGSVGWRSLLL